jgi:hypothetical protein
VSTPHAFVTYIYYPCMIYIACICVNKYILYPCVCSCLCGCCSVGDCGRRVMGGDAAALCGRFGGGGAYLCGSIRSDPTIAQPTTQNTHCPPQSIQPTATNQRTPPPHTHRHTNTATTNQPTNRPINTPSPLSTHTHTPTHLTQTNTHKRTHTNTRSPPPQKHIGPSPSSRSAHKPC